MQNINKWARILNDIRAGKEAICPDCGGNVQGSFYSNDNKIGFVILECECCKQHIRFSRISIPPNVKVNNF